LLVSGRRLTPTF
jgi:hypothetical protein